MRRLHVLVGQAAPFDQAREQMKVLGGLAVTKSVERSAEAIGEQIAPRGGNAESGGRLACPPEDCGGIPGFYDLVEAITDPDHEYHEELRDWLGDDFDPRAFPVDGVNKMLLPKRRHSKVPRN